MKFHEKMIPNFLIIEHRLKENGCSIGSYKPSKNMLQIWNEFGQDEWIIATLECIENYLVS